jgi:copper chaperone CopZ
MKFIHSFVLAIIVLTAAVSIAFSQTSNSNHTTDSLKITTIKVKGITCAIDLEMISKNVEEVKGVSSCKSGKQGTTTTFKVKYNPILVTENEIFAAIENTSSCKNSDERPYKVKR